MERICGMLTYINGSLTDESDDLIDDTVLYCMFVRLAARIRELYSEADRETILEQTMAAYEEPFPGAGERVKAVLRVMLTAYLASRMRQEAENQLQALK